MWHIISLHNCPVCREKLLIWSFRLAVKVSKFLCKTFLCVEKFVDLTLQACPKRGITFLCTTVMCVERNCWFDLAVKVTKYLCKTFLCVEKYVDLTFQACPKRGITFLCTTVLCVERNCWIEPSLQACSKCEKFLCTTLLNQENFFIWTFKVAKKVT